MNPARFFRTSRDGPPVPMGHLHTVPIRDAFAVHVPVLRWTWGSGTPGPGDPPPASASRARVMDVASAGTGQGGSHGPELSRAGASAPRRAAEPLAVAGQVAAGNPALHRAVLAVDRVLRRHRHRVLRDLVHRALPPRAVQLQPGGAALVVAGRLL